MAKSMECNLWPSSSKFVWWSISKFVVLFVMEVGLLVGGLLSSGCDSAQQQSGSPKQASKPAVEATVFVQIVQGNDGIAPKEKSSTGDKNQNSASVQKFEVDWTSGMTAFAALEATGVPIQSTGAGETRFVSSINALENEGSGGDNWIFSVNRKTGNKSCDATIVNSGDQIEWSFGDYKIDQ